MDAEPATQTRKYFRTILEIEVLSEDTPFEGGFEELAVECAHGECSGAVLKRETTEISGKQAADALTAQGSDPSFFFLDDEGEVMQ